jgi:hypothetical protein
MSEGILQGGLVSYGSDAPETEALEPSPDCQTLARFFRPTGLSLQGRRPQAWTHPPLFLERIFFL